MIITLKAKVGKEEREFHAFQNTGWDAFNFTVAIGDFLVRTRFTTIEPTPYEPEPIIYAMMWPVPIGFTGKEVVRHSRDLIWAAAVADSLYEWQMKRTEGEGGR